MTVIHELMRLREMREADHAFVVSTWVMSLRTPEWVRDSGEYKSNMRRSAALTIARSKRNYVLVSSDSDSTIMGWACGDDDVIHHAYARPELLRTKSTGRAWIDALITVAMGQ